MLILKFEKNPSANLLKVHGTIIWAGATYNWIRYGLEIEYNSLETKKKTNVWRYQTNKVAKNFILVFGYQERTKKGWKWICNYVYSNYNCNYVHVKISPKVLVKPLLHSVFSLITWITKPQIKQLVESHQQILAKSLISRQFFARLI